MIYFILEFDVKLIFLKGIHTTMLGCLNRGFILVYLSNCWTGLTGDFGVQELGQRLALVWDDNKPVYTYG